MTNFARNLALWVIIALLLVLLFNWFTPNNGARPGTLIPYSEFVSDVNTNKVRDVNEYLVGVGLREPACRIGGSILSTFASSMIGLPCAAEYEASTNPTPCDYGAPQALRGGSLEKFEF